ncbi:BlaI/MecI/CopY family transcriptional regulator [Streptomyces sp. NPDC002205]|uniref:BlaI/MecI/CopY family transcriptional regulator n=1 Tax=unclassified Streptomyces TaxID=2593676 RepID=UPI00331DF2BE
MTEEHGERRPAGELEASVLAALWASGAAQTPGDVRRSMGEKLARTTVTTILTRLHAKGLVTRTRSGRSYAYLPAQDASRLTARRMHAELDRGADRESVLALFVSDLSDEDEERLRALFEGERGGPG